MKTLAVTTIAVVLLAVQAHGQGSSAIRRARELSKQNDVRQGVAPPSQPQKPTPPAAQPTPGVPQPTVSNPQQNTAKIQADLTAIKPGSPASPEQKQQLTKDIAVAVRGTKPSLPTVTAFVNSLTAALADKGLTSAEQARLAQDIEAILNSAAMPITQFDAVIADVQAVLQVGTAEAGGVKRSVAISVANDLKAVGTEVRRGAK